MIEDDTLFDSRFEDEKNSKEKITGSLEPNNSADGQNFISESKNFRGFLLIFACQSISLLGSAVVQFSLIWWITDLTGNSMILSLAIFFGTLPLVILSPFAGVFTDRLNRKLVLLTTDLLQALVIVFLAFLFTFEIVEVWYILILLAVRGTLQAFQLPVGFVIVSLMVPTEKIPRINSLNYLFNSLILVASPAIGATALVIFSIEDILWLDIITFIPSLIAITLVDIPRTSQLNEFRLKSAPSFLLEFKEGVVFLKNSVLLPVFVMYALTNVFLHPLYSLLPLFIKKAHSGGIAEYAMIESMFQIGMLMGSGFMLLWKDHSPKVMYIIISWFAVLIGAIMVALVPFKNYGLISLAFWIWGFSAIIGDIHLLSIMQVSIPVELQGRIFSVVFTSVKSVLPFALVVVGIFGEIIDLTLIFRVFPFLLLFMTILFLFITDIVHLDTKLALNAQKGK